MPLAPIINNQLTPQTRVLSVYAGGLDITGDCKWDRFTVTDSGTNAKGTANIRIERTPSAVPEITDQALVRIEDLGAAGGEVFRGFIRARRPSQDPAYEYLDIIADDITTLLDDAIIDVELRQPESMQARIGYLWGKYAGSYLSGDLSNVAAIGSTLPIQRFALVSLRNAIEMTIAQASSTADYYLDMLGKLHVFVTETNDAPFNIDADAPTGIERAPESLDVEYDSNAYANRVFVSGATPQASGYFQDDAAIAAANGLVRTSVVQAPDCTTAAMAQSLGLMYLGRVKTAKPRGMFTISSPDDSWRAGQNVLVTSAAHGLSAQSYRIARVTTKVIKPGSDLKRRYTVEFGGARAGAGLDGVAPLIAGGTAGIYMLDQLGNALVSVAANAAIGGLGPVARRYIMSGVYNGDFVGPPPGPDAPVDDTTNPLPYWSFVQASGTAITGISVVDSAAGSGRKFKFNMIAGAAGDDAYIEQLVPVNAARGQNWVYVPRTTFQMDSVVNSMEFYIATQYMKVDGVTTTGIGADDSRTTTTGGANNIVDLGVAPNNGALPTDAFWLRIRTGFRRGAEATGSSGSVFVTEVRSLAGPDGLRFPDFTNPNTYSYGRIIQNNGEMQFGPDVVGLGGSRVINFAPAGFGPRIKHYPLGAIATRTTTQTITTATDTMLSFNVTDISDPFGFHDPAVNPSRFTVPTSWGGTYLLMAHAVFAANATGDRVIGWAKNGTASANEDQTYQGDASISCRMNVSSIMELAAADYVEVRVFQDSGGDLAIQAGTYATVYYIGETA